MSVRTAQIELTSTQPATMSQAGKQLVLTTIIATGAPWKDPVCQLFTGPASPTPDTVRDEFVEPGWTGYANQTPVPNVATPAGVYGATVEYASIDWESADDAETTILGVVYYDAGLDNVLGYVKFDESIPVSGIQTITVVTVLLMP